MSYQDVKDKLYHGHRKIANNTYLTLNDDYPKDECIDMRLHHNLIARFYPNYLQLYSAGWYTTITKNRLNLALAIAINNRLHTWKKIYQVDYQWYYGNYHRYDPKFYSGIKIDYTGKVIKE